MVGKMIGGLAGVASGIIGSKGRKKEQAAAQKEFNTHKAAFEMADTSNVYENMENTMEDLTVNQGAAQFQAEQANQGLANTMGAMSGAAGGSGIAAMAQALAGQQQNSTRQASLDIGRQEQANQMAERQQAGNLQLYERKGELISRDAEAEKNSTLLGMSQQRLGAANTARKAATSAIINGATETAGAFAGGGGVAGLKGAIGGMGGGGQKPQQ